MKMKYLWSLMALIMVTMMSVGLASCSSSDDDEEENSEAPAANSFVGTWRKYKSETGDEFKNAIWVFEADGMMYEHDIDDNLNIIEGHSETFKYKTENNHLYSQKQKEGKTYDWKDEGAYSITGDILTLTKEDKVKRLKKIK